MTTTNAMSLSFVMARRGLPNATPIDHRRQGTFKALDVGHRLLVGQGVFAGGHLAARQCCASCSDAMGSCWKRIKDELSWAEYGSCFACLHSCHKLTNTRAGQGIDLSQYVDLGD